MITITQAALLAAQVTAEAAPAGGETAGWVSFVPMILILLVFWFILVVPQRREAQAKEKMRQELKKGDAVVTIGGMHGEVVAHDKNTVTVRVAAKVDLVFERAAIARRAGDAAAAPEVKS